MKRTICSIWYRPLETRRQYRKRDSDSGFLTVFSLKAASRDSFELLTVHDMEEDYKFSSMAPRTTMHKETTGELVASDLVNEWVGNLSVGSLSGDSVPGCPGVFICRELDEKDEDGKVLKPAVQPGPNELARARQSQAEWCRARVYEAAEFAKNAQFKRIRMDEHGAAADYLGEHFSWQDAAAAKPSMQGCPVCGTETKAGVFICIGCKEVIDPIGYAAWKKDRELREMPKAKAPEPELVGAGKSGK